MTSHFMARQIIKFFADRKGFDDWWDSVDYVTKTELEADLARKLEEWRQDEGEAE